MIEPPRRRGRQGKMGRELTVSFTESFLAVLASWRFNFRILFLVAISQGMCAAAVYHVSLVGDDSATGDVGHPLRTISRAAELAGAGDTVVIGPGVYREWVGITRSGTGGKPITFQAEKVGTAVVSGADVLAMWVEVLGHPGQFISDWPYDFGAEQGTGQVLWESHPLREVTRPGDLSP